MTKTGSKFWMVFCLIILMLPVTGCDDPQTGKSETEPSANSADQLKNDPNPPKPAPLKEPAKKDLRVIGDGKLPAPKIVDDQVERLEPKVTAEEKNALEKARIPKKPGIFARPVAKSAGILVSGDHTIILDRIDAPEIDAQCAGVEGKWPCGNFAKSALQRLIRARSITCEGEWKDDKQFHGTCKLGNRDLATWLVKQGWAKSDDQTLQKHMKDAQKAKKGLWRN